MERPLGRSTDIAAAARRDEARARGDPSPGLSPGDGGTRGDGQDVAREMVLAIEPEVGRFAENGRPATGRAELS